jgi:hypothetical protein
MRGKTKIIPSIVQSVIVSMVNENARRGVHKFSVHSNSFSQLRADFDISVGVELFACTIEIPDVIPQPIENIGVNNREFAVAEVNSAKRPAILLLSIK